MSEFDSKLERELEMFNENVNVHNLPEIFHYWSNKYLRPLLEEYGITHPDDLFVKNMFASAKECLDENPTTQLNYLSIGSGNCDTEVRIAVRLRDLGLKDFCIDCLDLNPTMLDRGKQMAIESGVSEHLSFIETDLNSWQARKQYVSAIANQSLHHIQNLEGIFDQIKAALYPQGSFITSDMIGRNGHQRWPEALDVIDDLWRELPERYKFNHQLKRLELKFVNWDCSTEGFEGIRAQDILPLLIKNFHFEFFVSYSNLIDIFIDRSFGHNFRSDSQWDTDFIDRVQELDATLIEHGSIKPTHIMAVMKSSSVQNPVYGRGLSPEFCVRPVS